MDEPRNTIVLVVFIAITATFFLSYAIRGVRRGVIRTDTKRVVYRHEEPGTFWGVVIFLGLIVPAALVAAAVWELNR